MYSTSEKGFGARVGNAENLLASLINFADYQPLKPEFSGDNFGSMIQTTKGFNNIVAGKKQDYSLSLEKRIQIITKGTESIEKSLSSINATVKAIYGRNNKEARDVAAIIAKYRGANITVRPTGASSEETLSQSYQSYNSKLQFFADLIAYLRQFGANYRPIHDRLKADELQDLYQLAVNTNNEVMTAFTQFSQQNAARINSYKQLSEIALGIKESVKAQYGVKSTEYRLIKGLKI